MRHLLFVVLVYLISPVFLNAQSRDEIEKVPDSLIQTMITPVKWKDSRTLMLSNGDMRNPEYYLEDIRTGKRTVCTSTDMPSVPRETDYGLDLEAKNPTLSPDGSHVAFTLRNDLYSKELETGNIVRYTYDGSETVLNGWASWVYYEEILGRPGRYRSFWWSPDGRYLAFFRCDDTRVPMFPIYVAEGQHGYLERTRYPKAGDENPRVRTGIVPVEGGRIVWTDFDETQDQYFGQPYWTPDGEALWVQWMNRDQNHFVLYSVSPADGSKRPVYEESQDTWLEWIQEPVFTSWGLLMVRDFEKWQQVYLCSWDGSRIQRLTMGNNWGISILAFDEKTQMLYYTARCENSTRTGVYAVACSEKAIAAGQNTPQRLTPAGYNFTNVQFSPDFKHFTAHYSNVNTPTASALYSVQKGLLRILGDSKGPTLDKAMAGGLVPVTEVLFMTTEDGFTIPAVVTWPLHMEKDKKYPAIISIYGGPDAGSVIDRWVSPSRNYYWAARGVIQIAMDHRGSGHCGKAGMDMMHRKLGQWEIHDYKLWVDRLRGMGCLDPAKVGITGYSYGGYITALAVCTAGDYFPYGIAGAGVHDWMLYDSHYTERFMDLPADNAQGYEKASVIRNASTYGAGGPSVLLITHGTSDDNVHFQNSVQLVDELMKTGKHFEFMMYPAARHGYRSYQSAFSASQERDFWTRYLLEE